jgi:hypothetical protein
MQINDADVAELVDARDLKSFKSIFSHEIYQLDQDIDI